MNGNVDSDTVPLLLHKLCTQICRPDSGNVTHQYQLACRILGSHSAHTHHAGRRDDFGILEKIKKSLIRNGLEKDAVRFSELSLKLENDVSNLFYNVFVVDRAILKNRSAILCFLMNLHGSKSDNTAKSTAFAKSFALFHNYENKPEPPLSGNLNYLNMGGSCPSTIRSTLLNRNKNISSNEASNNMDTMPLLHDNSSNSGSKVISAQPKKSIGCRVAKVAAMFSNRDFDEEHAPLLRNETNTQDRYLQSSSLSASNSQKWQKEVSKSQLLREIVYAFQGIEGEVINYNENSNSFIIKSDINMSKSTKKMLLRLSELGWLYRKVRRYCDQRSSDSTLGLIGQSFIAALQQELTEYYRLLAVLEAQLHSQTQNSQNSGSSLTLHRLVVWTLDPHARLKALGSLVDVCKGLKGGALTSNIYSYLQHGDPIMTELITNVLCQVVRPLYLMLTQWIYEGELEDNFDEFFIVSKLNVLDEKLWHEKYSLRESMVPAFISMDQAEKILLIGKNINFIHQVCQNQKLFSGREAVSSLIENMSVESLFTQDTNNSFQALIDMAYEQTSNNVLDLMQTEYKFLDHMQALRSYLLLGQGDFIRHLMDLLEPELIKPADSLYLYSLSGVLETAIRSTNAQFADPEILKRLDVRLFEVSPGDIGWDVFSLEYHVDGPIGTIFTRQCMFSYLRLFNALWRSKRMEYILSSMWREQMSYSRALKEIPDLVPAFRQCYILSSEMVHFIQQIQYYITFEVMECSWDVFVKKVKNAKDLDDVIFAHKQFLDTVLARALLDEDSEELLDQLRSIYYVILQFEKIQNTLWTDACKELNLRQQYQDKMNANTIQGTWGTNSAEEVAIKQRRTEFVKKVIQPARSQLKILADSYQEKVRKFLLMLASHQDTSLQFLSFRLDFNEHYINKDKSLRTSMTYHYRRKSLQVTRSKSSSFLLQ
ncbi:Gamma-tubulin complex component 3 [Nymphon striatum]|nr:Gamma-tubulin complex component 3 [Nymphon striatum]